METETNTSLLGCCAFSENTHIPDCSLTVSLPYQMTWKKNDFKWGPEQQAFEQIKWDIVHATAPRPVWVGQDIKMCSSRANGPTCSVWQETPVLSFGTGVTEYLRRPVLQLKEMLESNQGTWAALEGIGVKAQLLQLPGDCQCWAGCSNGGSSLRIMQLVLHDISGLQWPYNELK